MDGRRIAHRRGKERLEVILTRDMIMTQHRIYRMKFAGVYPQRRL
jgi:hypothetical protein